MTPEPTRKKDSDTKIVIIDRNIEEKEQITPSAKLGKSIIKPKDQDKSDNKGRMVFHDDIQHVKQFGGSTHDAETITTFVDTDYEEQDRAKVKVQKVENERMKDFSKDDKTEKKKVMNEFVPK